MGCFKVANNLTELGDLTGEVKWDNTNEAVKKCVKLIKDTDKGFKLFASVEFELTFSILTTLVVDGLKYLVGVFLT